MPPVKSIWQQHLHTSAMHCRSMKYNGKEHTFIVEYDLGTEQFKTMQYNFLSAD